MCAEVILNNFFPESYLLCCRVLGSSGRFSVVWDKEAEPGFPEDMLPWKGKNRWRGRSYANENKEARTHVVENHADKMGQMRAVITQLSLCYFFGFQGSPWFARTWCCQDARPNETSGCSVACRSAATRTAAAMKCRTSGRPGTGLSAGLKTGKHRIGVEEWRIISLHVCLYWLPVRKSSTSVRPVLRHAVLFSKQTTN